MTKRRNENLKHRVEQRIRDGIARHVLVLVQRNQLEYARAIAGCFYDLSGDILTPVITSFEVRDRRRR